MTEKTCPQCAEAVKAEAKICRFCHYSFETGQPAEVKAAPAPPLKRKGLGKGCLVMVGILVMLIVIGAIAGGDQKPAASNPTGERGGSATVEPSSEGQGQADVMELSASNLTGPQQNAARSAQQYISISGFSRDGLIDQLSSDAGNGYAVADATVAVDSLNIDWKEQAARSAKQYLEMSGFSCKGLIEQLSSSAGSQYTVSEATFGAKQAGAC
ncbi:Ltp family lipoprotein [Sphingobium abikonense]|uniref:Ltp family lipoprotein n=1 Tax=Sphingobium abikonense TaxID=86193 RepID=UPI000B2D9CF2|nr:Ltp family lipoprotein [Sphingobium abikonense]